MLLRPSEYASLASFFHVLLEGGDGLDGVDDLLAGDEARTFELARRVLVARAPEEIKVVKISDSGVFYHNGGIAEANDITKNIIGYTKNKTSSGRTPHEIFKDTIITSSDKLIAEFEEGKLGGNIFYSYVFFYKALKIELDIIELYEKLILRLYDDKNNTEQFKTYG